MEVLFFGSGRQGFWRAVEVYLVGCQSSQAGVGAHRVVELDIAADPCPRLADRCVSVQVHLLVFDQLPESLDKGSILNAG